MGHTLELTGQCHLVTSTSTNSLHDLLSLFPQTLLLVGGLPFSVGVVGLFSNDVSSCLIPAGVVE